MEIEREGVIHRVQSRGVGGAALIDLLAVVLAREPADVAACEADARRLLQRLGPSRLLEISADDLRDSSGLEPFEALQRLAAIELGRRSSEASIGKSVLLDSGEAVAEEFKWLEREKQEHFCAAFLDSKGVLISTRTVHIGTVNMSVVGPREVFRDAIRESAASLIVVHNHPSGDPEPSPEDISVTKRLAEVGKMLDIPLLDHVIIGHDRFVSLQERGHL